MFTCFKEHLFTKTITFIVWNKLNSNYYGYNGYLDNLLIGLSRYLKENGSKFSDFLVYFLLCDSKLNIFWLRTFEDVIVDIS